MANKKTCKTCKHWKNNQAELDYAIYDGICTCFKWKFDMNNESDVKVLDRNNRSTAHMGINRFESVRNTIPIGTPERSRYCFVTSENFGCIHHDTKD